MNESFHSLTGESGIMQKRNLYQNFPGFSQEKKKKILLIIFVLDTIAG